MTRKLRTLAIALQLGLLGSAQHAAAAERVLKGAEILSMLKGARVEGQGWSQNFDDGGATSYSKGPNQESGRWDVRGDQYCSVWPPSDSWACYAMTIDDADPAAEKVMWIGAEGTKTTGHLIRKGQ